MAYLIQTNAYQIQMEMIKMQKQGYLCNVKVCV